MAENLHSGHRQRVRKEFLEHGIDENTPAHKVFELLLFYSIPRCDTNEIAHRLLERFGSISAVLDAPIKELVEVKGISESSALLLKLVIPIARVYKCEKQKIPVKFNSLDEIGDFLLERYFGYTQEVLSLVCLDGNGRFLSCEIIEKGDIASVGVSARKIIQAISKTNARCVALAHNHPGGVAVPSAADISVTQMIAEAVSHIDVKLLDHFIIANEDYVSMAQSAKYREIFK